MAADGRRVAARAGARQRDRRRHAPPTMTAAFRGPVVSREQRRARHEHRRHPRRQHRPLAASYSACAIWRIVPPRSRASRKSSRPIARRRPRLDLRRAARARRTPSAQRIDSFAAASSAVQVGRRVRLGVPARARIGNRLVHRAAELLHPRQHGVARAVQDRVDPRARDRRPGRRQRAHDRHGAADGGLEPQLPPLPLGERQQRRPMVRDDLLVGGDDGLPGQQGRPHVVDGRLAVKRPRRGCRRRWRADRRTGRSRRARDARATRRQPGRAGRACRARGGRRCG